MTQAQRVHGGAPRDRRRLLNQVAALTLLLEAPCHGYKLYRRFVDLIGVEAAPRKQSIYDVIDQLAADGLVEGEREEMPSSERQPRTTYLVTPAGRRLVADVVEHGFSRAETREEFRVRLRCAGSVRDYGLLRTALEARRLKLLVQQRELPPPRSDLPTEPVVLARRLMDKQLVMELESELEWVEWALAMVTAADGDRAVR